MGGQLSQPTDRSSRCASSSSEGQQQQKGKGKRPPPATATKRTQSKPSHHGGHPLAHGSTVNGGPLSPPFSYSSSQQKPTTRAPLILVSVVEDIPPAATCGGGGRASPEADSASTTTNTPAGPETTELTAAAALTSMNIDTWSEALAFLPPQDLCHLRSTCIFFHHLITFNEQFWFIMCLRYGIRLDRLTAPVLDDDGEGDGILPCSSSSAMPASTTSSTPGPSPGSLRSEGSVGSGSSHPLQDDQQRLTSVHPSEPHPFYLREGTRLAELVPLFATLATMAGLASALKPGQLAEELCPHFGVECLAYYATHFWGPSLRAIAEATHPAAEGPPLGPLDTTPSVSLQQQSTSSSGTFVGNKTGNASTGSFSSPPCGTMASSSSFSRGRMSEASRGIERCGVAKCVTENRDRLCLCLGCLNFYCVQHAGDHAQMRIPGSTTPPCSDECNANTSTSLPLLAHNCHCPLYLRLDNMSTRCAHCFRSFRTTVAIGALSRTPQEKVRGPTQTLAELLKGKLADIDVKLLYLQRKLEEERRLTESGRQQQEEEQERQQQARESQPQHGEGEGSRGDVPQQGAPETTAASAAEATLRLVRHTENQIKALSGQADAYRTLMELLSRMRSSAATCVTPQGETQSTSRHQLACCDGLRLFRPVTCYVSLFSSQFCIHLHCLMLLRERQAPEVLAKCGLASVSQFYPRQPKAGSCSGSKPAEQEKERLVLSCSVCCSAILSHLYLCLHCGEVRCRAHGPSGHMYEHSLRTGHCMVISFSNHEGGLMWCYSCDRYLGLPPSTSPAEQALIRRAVPVGDRSSVSWMAQLKEQLQDDACAVRQE